MTDIFEQTLKQLNGITDTASQKVGSFFKKAVNKGEEYAVKGKIQIEIEKLKWDLKQLYIELGCYVALKNRDGGVMDFSHDDQYIRLLDKIENQRQYISERVKDKTSSDGKENDDESAQKLLENPLS
ncbi:MAG: hypothetical protein HN820_01285 [Candidatus Marinimicrobia bacterium]|nr:hypothetical protein [Candidatus Neomarinimicrobiota bacterium]